MTNTTTDFVDTLSSLRIIPVVVIDDASAAADLGTALKTGGLPVVEVTFRTPAAPGAITALAADPDLLVGAGTVIDPEQVDRAVDCGARFIVSPGLSGPVVARGLDLGVPVLPGIGTATELMRALALGVSVVKVFPAATLGGPGAVRAFAAPFPAMRFVPTGGIGLTDLADYLAIDQVIAVGGSWMVPRSAVAAHDVDLIAQLVAEAVASAQKRRTE